MELADEGEQEGVGLVEIPGRPAATRRQEERVFEERRIWEPGDVGFAYRVPEDEPPDEGGVGEFGTVVLV